MVSKYLSYFLNRKLGRGGGGVGTLQWSNQSDAILPKCFLLPRLGVMRGWAYGGNTEAVQGQYLLLPHSHLQACGCRVPSLPTLPRLLSSTKANVTLCTQSPFCLFACLFVHFLKVCCVLTTEDSALSKISPHYLGSSSQCQRKISNRLLRPLVICRGCMGCNRSTRGRTELAGTHEQGQMGSSEIKNTFILIGKKPHSEPFPGILLLTHMSQ